MFLFDNIEVIPHYDALEAMIDDVGEDALVVAKCSAPAAPMQYIMRDLMGMTPFFFALMDKPDKLRDLSSAIAPYFEEIMAITVKSPADVLFFGSNTDETITPPPFYEEHLMPWIARFADMAHAEGKFTQLHADGENQALFDLYRQSGIDILEAVATAPMTKSDIHEVLAKTEGMTVWGGIPSVALMPDSFDDAAFERFMADTLAAVGTGPNFILGVSDTTPPDADFSRLLRIRDML
jgi:uroporphyrinogen-III decarboxylase